MEGVVAENQQQQQQQQQNNRKMPINIDNKQQKKEGLTVSVFNNSTPKKLH